MVTVLVLDDAFVAANLKDSAMSAAPARPRSSSSPAVRLAVAFVGLALGLGTGVPASSAATIPVGTVVSMGDSYASGEGVSPFYANAYGDSTADRCHRSRVSGHMQFGNRLLTSEARPTTEFVHSACSGATASSVVTGMKGESSQLLALGPATRVVTLSAGGNDVGFRSVIEACNIGKSADTCGAELLRANQRLLDLTTPSAGGQSPIESLYRRIRERAPRAQLVVTGYPRLFPDTWNGSCSGIQNSAVPVINQLLVKGNGLLKRELNKVDGTFVDLAPTFRGHSSCEPNVNNNWINYFASRDPQLSFHPNRRGQDAIANQLWSVYQSKPVSIDVVSPQSLVLGRPFSQALVARGVFGTASWSLVSGALPPGLTLTAAGALSGTPTTAGTSTVTLQVVDSRQFHAAQKTITIGVTAPALHLVTASLPTATAGSAYSVQLQATGGQSPYRWSAGALPSGLALSADGLLSGTPTSPSTYPVAVVVTDAAGASRSSTLTLTVGGQTWKAIAVGTNHTCGLTASGAVKCWGENRRGQLGDGTTTTSSTPVQVTGLTSGITQISSRGSHTCALSAAGSVSCWGDRTYGRLGDGTSAGSPAVTPVQVTGLSSGVSQVSSGAFHTCAVLTSGAARCWGWNDQGQLGTGTTANSSIPVQVTGLSGAVRRITAGTLHTCAVTTSGAAQCWGQNLNGNLGSGGTDRSSSVPVPVSGLSSGVAQADAAYHSCAITSAGAVSCWGDNTSGELGNGTTTNSGVPIPVVGLSSAITQVSVGNGHSCALSSAGAAKCWGYNGDGAVGNSTNVDASTPVQVTGLTSGVTQVMTGVNHSCAVTSAGEAKCWGDNTYGQLGNGTTISTNRPIDLP